MISSLYSTTIIHERFNSFKNKFKYYILSLYIDLSELNILSKKINIFSYNRFNFFSFYEKDHGYRDGRPLKSFVEDYLLINNIAFKSLRINILCFPRILGYVFNPLSIIYCYEENKLLAIFYEVKNTSNEQHTYCFASNLKNNKKIYHHSCEKNFYVSPFIGMKTKYKFYNTLVNNKISITIDLYDDAEKKILTASQFGKKISLNSSNLLKQLLKNPLLSIKVISGILYEALYIVIKGGKYYARNKKESDSISFEGKL